MANKRTKQKSTTHYTKNCKANITKSQVSTQMLRKGMKFLLYMLKYPSKLFMKGSRFIFRYNFNT